MTLITHSIRLTLRRGQKLDLRLKEITQGNCCVQIHSYAGGDYDVTVDWPLESGCEPAGTEREVDDTVQGATAAHDVGEDDRYLVGIGNQSGPLINSLLTHQKSPIGKIYDVSSLNSKALGVES